MLKRQILRAFAVTLCACTALSLLYTAPHCAADGDTGVQPAEGYQQIASNKSFELYLEKNEYSVAVRDKAGDAVWYSSPPDRGEIEGLTGAGGLAAGSMLLVNYFDTSTQSAGSVNSLLGSVREKSAEATLIDGGVRIDYDFSRKKEGFKIPVEITLNEKGLTARILFSGIEEYSTVLITDISLLPYFGAGTGADSGFALLPDGSGAVMGFNTGRAGMEVFSKDVYGRDMALTTVRKTAVSEDVCLPVFGIMKNTRAFTAFVTKGAGSASINAFPGGLNGPMNCAYMSFCYRKTDNIVLADATWTPKDVVFVARSVSQRSEVELQYVFLPEKASSLAGMAAAYREHLISDMGLRESGTAIPGCATLYGAVKKQKYFLGIPYTSICPLTSFSDAEKIAAAFGKKGIEGMVYSYKGAFSGGLDDAVPVKASFERALGGKKGWKSLLSAAKENGYSVLPDAEFLRIYKSSFGWRSFNSAAKNISRSVLKDKYFLASTFYENTGKKAPFMLSPNRLLKAVDSLTGKAGELLPFGLSAGSVGATVYSDFDSSHTFDEDAQIEEYVKSLKKIRESTGAVMTSGGYEYAALNADIVTDVPVSDSGYSVTESRVPFYQMVFSGYLAMASRPLNDSSNYTDSFLLCIETGTAPGFSFTASSTSQLGGTGYEGLISTEFSLWEDTAADAYTRYNELFSKIGSRIITDYRIDGDVRCVSYADGTEVYVNYSSAPAVSDGNEIPAKSFIAVKKQ